MTELEQYFIYKCEKGLAERGLAGKKEYEERLKYEVNIIKKLKFCTYFLVVQDIISWAICNDIPVGPGRGSAAGSLVSYVLKITHLDPIKYNLIFERFLSPNRISWPDIDMDFCEVRRSEVIQYVREKYGEDKVANIGTFGAMKAKGAIRDVCRALGYPYAAGDKLARLTLEPIAGKTQDLATCYQKVRALKQIRYGSSGQQKTILEWADQVENRLRTFGVHAAGIIISQDELTDIIPLYPGKNGEQTSQFEMNTIEELGLIKFDFLGIRALTTIKRCTDMIKERHDIDIDPLEIPVDDEATYKLLQAGNTEGVFQMEGSQGIRDLVVQIQPRSLEDLSVIVSVFRPGPLGSDGLKHYLKVRAGDATPQYLIPELEPILKETDGFLIYQEQIMRSCTDLAEYTMTDADVMRKVVGKKIVKKMKEQREKFVTGCTNNKISKSDAEKLFKDIEAFAEYGFNKSHAIAYAYIGYQMAYLKAHYPLEFMCSCLISDSDEVDKVIQYIGHCKENGIEILGPSINKSEYNFSIDGKAIRFGLGAIKNLGKPVQEIIEDREGNGPFEDLLDFAERVDLSKINRRKLESLVLAGAFDGTGEDNRASLMSAIDEILHHKEMTKRYTSKMETYGKKMEFYEEREQAIVVWNKLSKGEKKGKKKPNRIKLPVKPEKPSKPTIPVQAEMLIQDVLTHEKELLGFYVSGHPLDNVKETTPYTIKRIKEEALSSTIRSKFKTRIIAIPSMIKVITTKKNKQKMAYLALEDKTGTIQAVIMPNKFAEYEKLIDIQTPALYNVELEVTGDGEDKIAKLVIYKVGMLRSIREFRNRPLKIITTMDKSLATSKILSSIRGGGCKIQLGIKSDEEKMWKVEEFECSGTRDEIEKRLKGVS